MGRWQAGDNKSSSKKQGNQAHHITTHDVRYAT